MEKANKGKGGKKRGEEPAYLKYGKKRYSGPKTNLKPVGEVKDENTIRLNKYIAQTGVCTRREADKMIEIGAVSVNGKVVMELGTKININDKVQVAGETIRNEKKVYILLNKPKDFTCKMDDPTNRRSIYNLIKNACKQQVFTVGKLDRDVTGVLLITNDTDLNLKLTSPKHDVKKIYQVTTDQPVSHQDFLAMQEGIRLEDGFVKPDEIAWATKDNRCILGVEIHTGKKQIVQRIFEHFKYKVVKLDRVYFAGLTKKNLKRGEYRFLTEQEIAMLKMLK
jgi:23S rRNA pseudouridine2605 synthase